MKKFLLIIMTIIINCTGFAQTSRNVSGVVKDSTGSGIIAATVKLIIEKGAFRFIISLMQVQLYHVL